MPSTSRALLAVILISIALPVDPAWARPPGGGKNNHPAPQSPVSPQTHNVPESRPFNDAERAIGVNLQDTMIIEANAMVERGELDEAIAKLKDRLKDKSANSADGSRDDTRLGLAIVFLRAGKPGDAKSILGNINAAYKKPGQACKARMLRRVAEAQKKPTKFIAREEWFGALRQFRTDALTQLAKDQQTANNYIDQPDFREVPVTAEAAGRRIDEVLAARVSDDHSDAAFRKRFADDIAAYVQRIQSKKEDIRRQIQRVRTAPGRVKDQSEIERLEGQIVAGDKAIRDLGNVQREAESNFH